MVPYIGEQCAYAVLLLYNADNFSVTKFVTDAEHNHDEICDQITNPRLNNYTKEIIRVTIKCVLIFSRLQLSIIMLFVITAFCFIFFWLENTFFEISSSFRFD